MFKFVFRILLLVAAFFLYFTDRERLNFVTILQQGFDGIFLWIIWIHLVVGMLYRVFPNKTIAIGARKHFACSYKAMPVTKIDADLRRLSDGQASLPNDSLLRKNKGALLSAFAWLTASTSILFVLYLLDMLTPVTVLILALIYSVLDIAFILFFCPFRAFFMRNRCCVVCRIYNWDYFMMCALLILFPSFYSLSLFLLSMVVVLCWETSLHKNPHFFMRETNENLSCSLCKDIHCKKNGQASIALMHKKPV
ncbi:MAG: hypothetical protein FWC91_04980 [Defluviitaleaceae bacterium]|nr:hypothetical protein [Defluviitaleaceae bacterium]